MAPKLKAPTVKELRAILTCIGSATSGKRESLLSRLSQDLGSNRMPISIDGKGKTRILSIDMGIKNLAFCVADVQSRDASLRKSEKGGEEIAPNVSMKIQAWRRLDVAEEVSRLTDSAQTSKGRRSAKASGTDEEEVEGPYTPSALSKTAYSLLTKTLLPYQPDVILIERQRWRSAGGPAIQQWTVRVNTLEGMFWAILTTLRAKQTQRTNPDHGKNVYEILGVDPKRIGNFWLGQDSIVDNSKTAVRLKKDDLELGPGGEVKKYVESNTTVKKLSRGKAEKKAKIQLLRSWLTDSPHHARCSSIQDFNKSLMPLPTWPAIDFEFSPEAENTRAVLCTTVKAGRSRKEGISKELELKKVDDVTDCFLQAAAWVTWEENRSRLQKEWGKENIWPQLSK